MPFSASAATAKPHVVPAVVASGDWAQFRDSPTHVGYNTQEDTISASNVGALAVAWTGATGDAITSSPAVAGGVVYVGSQDGKLYAYAVGCGSGGRACDPLWTGAAGTAIAYSSPAIANGVVYIGSWQGNLYAFDAAGVTGCSGTPKTCTPLWTAAMAGASIASSPTVVAGVVYVGGTNDKLYAFDAAGVAGCSGSPKTCAPLWTATTGGWIEASPAVANGVVYIGSGNDLLYAFDAAGSTRCSGSPKTCAPLWTGATGGYISSSPAVANGVVYIGSFDDDMYAFAVGCGSGGSSCSPLWTGATGSYVSGSSPAVADGVVYVGSWDDKLYAFGITGDWPQFHNTVSRRGDNVEEFALSAPNVPALGMAWKGAVGAHVESSPAVANGVVYVGTYDSGKLYAYAVGCASGGGTCQPLWTAATGNWWITSAPAVANGVVYVGGSDGMLYAFDAAGVTGCSGSPRTCAPLWTGATGEAITSSPAVSNGVVYVGSDDGKLYAFDAAGVTGCTGNPKTCSPIWTGTTGAAIRSVPAVAQGVVYVGSENGMLFAFDAAGVKGCGGSPKACMPLWTGATGNAIYSSPAVADGVVYVGSNDHKLYAFDAAGVTGCSGSPKACLPLWTGATGGQVYSSPAVANGVVYVGSMDDSLYAFDAAGATRCSGSPRTCLPLWTALTQDSIESSPAVANGVVYVGSDDDNVYAYAVGCGSGGGSCASIWSYTTGGVVYSSPAVSNGVVYIGSRDDNLYAFALPAGVNQAAATFHASDPARVLDSRPTGSGHTNIGLAGKFHAGAVRTFRVSGVVGVGASKVAVPTNATAVTGNLTIVGETADGLVALGPSMTPTGDVTTINFIVGDTRANNVTLGLGPNGTLSAVYRSAAATLDLIFDVTGYFTPDATGATYSTVAPGRVLDTRKSGSGHTNIGLTGKFTTKTVRTFPVAGVKALGWASALVPAGATAVTGNLTVTNATSIGYVSVGPTIASVPKTSTLNVAAGANIANGVTVALNAGKLQAVWDGTAGSSADVIFDVTGFFTTAQTGLKFYPIAPVRDLDTSTGVGFSFSFVSGEPESLTVAGFGGVAANAAGIAGNLTILNPSSNGYAFISPTTVATPTSSTINISANKAGANGFDVALSTGSLAIIWVGTVGSTADVALDVTGYWK
jgi:outer membrane protein assembly factor BamB